MQLHTFDLSVIDRSKKSVAHRCAIGGSSTSSLI
jgi:hypothetical protein